MIYTKQCSHCGSEFDVALCDYHHRFCPTCELMFRDGTLRVCDCCNTSWEVEQGECGYAVEHPIYKHTVVELCGECERQYKRGVPSQLINAIMS